MPVGQPQDPPLHFEPVTPTLHSLSEQQLAMGMHAAPQAFCMLGQLQEPPGPLQLCPLTVQSVLSQHCVDKMQLCETPQVLKPAVQVQAPPGPGQTWPEIVLQSLLVQQLESEMHCPCGLPATTVTHGCWPPAHTQLPVPGSQN